VIEAPVEKVFAFVTDFDNFLKASSPEIKMEVLSRDEGPQRVGSTVKVRTEVGNQVWEVEVETTEFVKNKRHAVRQKGGAFKKMLMTDTFEPTDGGTKWTSIVEYELPYSLLGKLIDNLKFRKDIEKGSDYYVNKTKELIEKE
jgi:ligand-binding SRPBCC domain-containing protein